MSRKKSVNHHLFLGIIFGTQLEDTLQEVAKFLAFPGHKIQSTDKIFIKQRWCTCESIPFIFNRNDTIANLKKRHSQSLCEVPSRLNASKSVI